MHTTHFTHHKHLRTSGVGAIAVSLLASFAISSGGCVTDTDHVKELPPPTPATPGTQVVRGRGGAALTAEEQEILTPDTASSQIIDLTIDPALQRQLAAALAKHPGGSAGAVIDVETGAVRATVDGQRAFPSGSIFKPISTIAAMTEGHAGEKPLTCAGSVELHGRTYKCHHAGGHGAIGVEEALATSCNIYTYKLAANLEARPIVDMAGRFGLGAPTGVGLAEDHGRVPAHHEGTPDEHHTIGLATGHGGVLVSPLQMARAYAAIATGALPALHMVESTGSADGIMNVATVKEPVPMGVDPAILGTVRAGLVKTVLNGTGKRAQDPSLAIAGKTGTTHGKTPDVLDGWFVAYAPADAPRFAAAVRVHGAGPGSQAATEIAAAMLVEANRQKGSE